MSNLEASFSIMLFAPISFTTIEGPGNIVFLGDNEYPRIDYLYFSLTSAVV